MRIALISGASRGIGLEFAKLIDEYSFDELWLVCGKNTPSFEFKTPVRVFYTDLREKFPFEELKNALNDLNPSVEYLVCSAGVGYNGSLENISEENIQNTIIINCSALSLLTKIAIPYMNENSKIIEIASGAGLLPQPNFSVYSASKAYVINFSRALPILFISA